MLKLCIASLVAGLSIAIGAVISSWKVQSLIVFLHWLNWPPFMCSDPSAPAPAWMQLLSRCFCAVSSDLCAYQGLPGASIFSATGPLGKVRGWHIPRNGTGRRTLLYLHGNAGNIAIRHRVLLYKLLQAPPLSCDVVAIDYAGFGCSDGWWPNEATAVGDALAALASIRSDPRHLFVWGHSLGSGIAVGAMAALVNRTGVAREGLPRGLVLEAPFTSVPDVPISQQRWLPEKLRSWLRRFLHEALAAHRLPSIERIENVAAHMDVAILHGKQDRVVPYEHGLRLAERGRVPLHTFKQGHDTIVKDASLVSVLDKLFNAWETK